MLQDYEKTLIKEAFNRCWGLQSALKSGKKNKDSLLLQGATESLAIQSGLRLKHIQENIEEVLEIENIDKLLTKQNYERNI